MIQPAVRDNEMTAEHLSMNRPLYIAVPPDHPLFLCLDDITAEIA